MPKKTGGMSRKNRKSSDDQGVRYAVVGLGHIAQNAVLPAFAQARENSRLAALISNDKEKLNKLGKRYKVPAQYNYEQLEECIEKEGINALYVAVPNALHREFVMRGIHSGVHVLSEKPLGINARECVEMDRAARQQKVFLMTAYRLHFDEANMEVVRMLRESKIGYPRVFSSVFSFQVAEENVRLDRDLGGGSLFDIGVYCINAARYLFQDEPVSVTGHLFSGHDDRFYEIDASCSALLEFSEGRIAQFTCSYDATDCSYYEMVGTRGRLRLNQAYDYEEPAELTVQVGKRENKKKFKRHDQFAAEIVYFSDCIKKGAEPEPSAREAMIDLEIIDAIRESAHTGERIDLSLPKKTRKPTEQQIITKPSHGREIPLVNAAPPTDEQ